MKRPKPLAASVMQALGFTSSWPLGNPKEPWWENEELNLTFNRRPTGPALIEAIRNQAKDEGRSEVRRAICTALDI